MVEAVSAGALEDAVVHRLQRSQVPLCPDSRHGAGKPARQVRKGEALAHRVGQVRRPGAARVLEAGAVR